MAWQESDAALGGPEASRVVPGYAMEQELYASATTIVARAHRLADNRPVVIKRPRAAPPSEDDIANLEHEYGILKSLAIPEVVEALELEVAGGSVALVSEDGGEPLSAGPRSGTTNFLRNAIAIGRAVAAVHDKGVIHKDLKPEHLLRGSDGKVRIIDFGLASRLDHEYCQWSDVDALEGTLAYIAPEQTGRLHRAIDRRSDLYALGVTLFEIATGQLPFQARDDLELVHCHIAKTAPRADALCPALPTAVASIIEKLMAKDAEDRYQSAAGLVADLERCLAEWERAGAIERFDLGEHDLAPALTIPQKLYGRSADLAALQEQLRSAGRDKGKLILIHGPSGIGKSALIHQLPKHLHWRGHLVAGRFDDLERSKPYSALAEACRELMKTILSSGSEHFARKRRDLLHALGGNARVIMDIIPELELIVGAQPAAIPLGPAESQNRFDATFTAFLAALVTPEEPLVMFLDGLQWADQASLRLLHLILTSHSQARSLRVIGSYRDGEVSAAHPLMHALDKLRQSNVEISELALAPLTEDDISSFVADALARPTSEVKPLATLLLAQTHGNPLDLGQHLEALHSQGLLHLDTERRRWTWDLERIAAQATDDVALVRDRISALPREAQRVVSLGACLGHEFDLGTVAGVAELSPAELGQGVAAAVQEDIIVLDHGWRAPANTAPRPPVASSARYRFLHDRHRQAAYALLPEAERPALHLAIGQNLRKALGEGPSDEELFAVAQQMNLGRDRLTDVRDRAWLAELNLTCARKAQATGAIPQALGLLGHAVALAGVHGWSESYRLTFAAKMAEAECEYLRGDNERTLALLDEIDARAADVLDRARGKNLRTMVLVRLGRPLDGCANSVAALRQLGVDLPELSDRELIEQSLHAEFVVLQPELAAAPLSELPEMSEPIQLARVQALAHAIPPAYQSVPPLMALMVFKAMRIMLRHGANDLLPFFLAQYAIANLVITEDHVAAHRLGKLAIAVGQGRKNTGTLGSVYFLCAAFVAYWCEPIADVIDLFEQGTQRCLETGDLLHATFCATLGTAHRQQAGRPLAEVRAAIARARELIERSGDRLNRQHLALRDRLAVVLADGSETPGSLDGGGFSEAEFLASVPEAYQPWLRAAQVVLRFHAGMHDEVLAAAAGHVANTGLPYVFDLALYAGLAHAALARAAQAEDRARHLEGLAEKASTFAAWARLCPANCAHRHALLAAELAELRGDTLAALTEYDRAITGAREHGFLQDLALAYELGGACHWRGLRISSALTFLRDAVRAYRAWGAGAKVHLLQECYPDLASGSSKGDEELAAIARQATDTASKRASTGHGRTGAVALDMESAMRAAQAIAGQLSSDKLLERLMRILAENAGAQRAVLLVPRDDDLYAEAERTINPDVVQVGMGKAVAQAVVPEKMIRYVARSHEAAVWNNGLADPTSLSDDAYLGAAGPRSALCVPLLHQGQLGAVLYLENHALTGGFNPARVSRIQFLAAQAASALANSRLYEEVNAARRDLEIRVCERTRELRQRNTDLRNVLDTVNQGLVTIDRFARVSGESSARAKSWFGALENGRSWIEVLADVDAAYAEQFQSFFTRLAQGEPLAKLRAEMPRKLAARERALELDLSPVGSEEGWQHMLVVASDITDRERQAHLEMELRQAQKLQAVGELAAGIAHEINTPAQFVGDSVDFISGVFKQMLELLGQYRKASKECSPSTLAELADAEDRADMAYNEENAPAALARATDGISRIATIVRAMKEFAHPDSREKTTADLNRALLTTLTIARNEYKYVAEADTALSPLPPVLCHVGDLNQVFLNIIVNAAHAIADVVGKSGGKGRITVRTFAAGDRVRIEITDTGCGILPEIRDRVYDPFFTTKEVGRGSGQGLAIARNIVVNQHGGQLSFTSEVGQGTTFIIELPVG